MECAPNSNGVPGRLIQLGHDVMELFMPLRACNKVTARKDLMLAKGSHNWFKRFGGREVQMLRFFVEPALLATAHAQRMEYKHVVLVGLSGGAWTLTWAAGMMPTVRLTIAIAGLCRDALLNSNREAPVRNYHFEQKHLETLITERQLYRLAAQERGRALLQVFHQFDQCCCAGTSMDWNRVRSLDAVVQSRIDGYFRTAILNESAHAVNPTDWSLVLEAIGVLQGNGHVLQPRLDHFRQDMLSTIRARSPTPAYTRKGR